MQIWNKYLQNKKLLFNLNNVLTKLTIYLITKYIIILF